MTIGVILLFSVLGFVAAEALLLSLWVPWFYRRGIARLRVAVPSATSLSTTQLGEKFGTGAFQPRLVFRALSQEEIAFQEGASFNLWSPYLPVMKGLIEQGSTGGGPQVVGILLWYPVIVLLAGIFGAWNQGMRVILGTATAICFLWLFLVAAQWARFRQVASALSDGPPNNELQRTKPAQATELRR
jgi:hypothetical protein